MKKKLAKILFILIVILLIAPVVALTILLRVQKDVIRQEVVLFLNDQVEGELSIKGLSYSALKGYPDLHVKVEQLVLKNDTRNLLEIGHLVVHVNSVDLLQGDIVVDELEIEDAMLFAVVDSLGNKPQLFKKNDSGPKKESSQLITMDEIRLINTKLIMGNDYKHNRKYIYINEGVFNLHSTDSLIILKGFVDGRLDTLVANNNTLFKEQPVRAEGVNFEINRATKELLLKDANLYAGDLKLKMFLQFTPFEDGQQTLFTIDGEENFNSFLDVFELHTDLDLEQINPSAKLVLSYRESGFVNPFERPYSELMFMIREAEFTGEDLPFPVQLNYISGNYNNGENHSPETVELIIDTLDASVNESSVQARFKLTDLSDPVIDAHLTAKLELSHFVRQRNNFKLSGFVEADLLVNGKISEIREMHLEGKQSATGKIDVSNLFLNVNDQEYLLEFKSGSTLLNNHMLEVTSLVGAFNKSVFNFHGKFRNLDHYLANRDDPLIGAFHLNFSELDLTTIDFSGMDREAPVKESAFSFDNMAFDVFIKGDKVITPIGPAKDLKLECRVEEEAININSVNFSYQEGVVNGKGRIAFNEEGIHSLNATVIGDFESLMLDLPEKNTKKTNEGNPGLDLPESIHVDIDLRVKDGAVKDFAFENLSLKSSLLNNDIILEEFEAELFDGHTSLNGKARLKELKLDGVWLYGDLSFEHLDLNTLIPANSEGGDKDLPQFPEDIDIDIGLQSRLTQYYDAELRDLDMKVRASKNRISLEEFSAELPFGRLSIELAVDQFRDKNPYYSGSIDLLIDTLNMDELLAMEAFNQAEKKNAGSDINQEKKPFLAKLPHHADLKINTTARRIIHEHMALENLLIQGEIINNGIDLKKMKLDFANGTIDIHGNLRQNAEGKYPGYIYSSGDEIDIQQVFLSFDDFDQDIFTSKNSSGSFSTASHYYFQMNEDFEFQVDENLWLLNVFVHQAEFNRVEPIEKSLFFVGHSSKDEMMVHQLNLNAYLIGDKIYFRDVYMNDNIADLGIFGEVDIEKMEMDLNMEISLTDLFLRSRKQRKSEKDQSLHNLDKDAKLFLQLSGPLKDHKMKKISRKKFYNSWDEMDALIKETTTEFRERKNAKYGNIKD